MTASKATPTEAPFYAEVRTSYSAAHAGQAKDADSAPSSISTDSVVGGSRVAISNSDAHEGPANEPLPGLPAQPHTPRRRPGRRASLRPEHGGGRAGQDGRPVGSKAAEYRPGGTLHALLKGREDADRPGDLVDRPAAANDERPVVHEVGGRRPNDMEAQSRSRSALDDDLDQAACLADQLRLLDLGEIDGAGDDVPSRVARRALRQADRADLAVGEHGVAEWQAIDPSVPEPKVSA